MVPFEVNVEKPCQVFADEHMLRTIIRNLISNAIKYSNKDGKISIDTEVKEGFMEVSVRDSGVGMEPKVMDSLFCLDSSQNTAMPFFFCLLYFEFQIL